MSIPSSLSAVLLVLLLLAEQGPHSSVAAASPGGRSRTRRMMDGGPPSVFSLFNIRPRTSKFWSESVIRPGFDDLEGAVPSDSASASKALLNYTAAGNVANYLKLSEVDSVYIGVPVNFIFIGFDGSGKHDFKLQPEELERWFTNIDHVIEHTRIPQIGEVLAPFYRITVEKAQQQHLPLVSSINYNFSVHAIHTGEKVSSVFEHAIRALSRRVDVSEARENSDAFWQVDIDQMEILFSALVDYLQIKNAYNIFILNPKHKDRVNYGYRRGLSESEISVLRENKALQSRILQSDGAKGLYLEFDKGLSATSWNKNHLSSTFAWSTLNEDDMMDWSRKCEEALRNIERLHEGKDTIDVIYEKAAHLVHGKNDEISSLYKSEIGSADLKGLHPDCLTDTWISKNRWGFIDLSAGPFTWGPAVGGEGVRTELTKPNVSRTVGAVAEISEDEAEDKLQETIRERFSSFGEENQAIDILLAEIDIYELFAFKHCQGRRVRLALCDELDERMSDLKNELEGYNTGDSDEHNRIKAVEALKRMEQWKLFVEVPEDHESYTVARDSFLAHLGSTLWGFMRHIVAPSVSDSAHHYYEKISFQLYFISQEKIRGVKQLPVNLKALTEGLSSIVLPSQEVMFSQHLLSLSEEPALTMAFSVARRAATVPLLLVNGTYRSTTRNYLDSAVLQHQLQRLSDQGALKGAHSNHRSILEVPIFWFIHSETLLLDKHYQAKALPNMVMVVQSEESSWESHLQCNGRSLLWDMRRPLKAAVAAAAEHMAGLLQPHLAYSHAHETALEDWTWSVGCNTLSITSQGSQISSFQSDVIARSYVFTAVEESIQVVNSAVQLLISERTSPKGFKIFKTDEKILVEKHNSVVSLWRRISQLSSALRYDSAVKLLTPLEEASHGFADAVNSTIKALHPVHCTRERKLDVQLDLTTAPAFLAVFALLWFVLRPRRAKPKIN